MAKALPQVAPWVAAAATAALVIGILLVFVWILFCRPNGCAVGNLFRKVFALSAVLASWALILCPEVGFPIVALLGAFALATEFFLARLGCEIEPMFDL
jgi:hypothetical protein